MLSAVQETNRAIEFDEDIVLVDRVLDGDEQAFQNLFHRYHDKVFAIARGVLLDSEEAADAVQEIFTLVYRNVGRFDRRARFSTWLFRIAVNRSIQQARKNRKHKKDVPLDDAEEASVEVEFETAGDPEVESAMMRLHPADRALLTLFYWDELSLNEIGESIGCSSNAAKTRLFRARERFRVQYETVAREDA
ncbi:MAG TPA: sigma-70 family RNA polymerase sigma factor [Fimbriimonadaceae bacterium]|nr:sigma-70 family RNA polymerase sigma factor [Fimbriimonadaceae bacterium]